MLIEHAGQPAFVRIDGRVAHVRFLHRKRMTQPRDLGRARKRCFQHGDGSCAIFLSRVHGRGRRTRQRKGRHFLGEIPDRQILLTENCAGVGLEHT